MDLRRLVTGYGLGLVLVAIPVESLDGGTAGQESTDRAIAAVVSGPSSGFVLDRDGQVIRVDVDGSIRRTASVGPYTTPFGTTHDDRVLFGGIRCAGEGCSDRVGEVTVLDPRGSVDAALALVRMPAGAPGLDGMAFVGSDDDGVWINGGGTLFHVALDPVGVLAEVPWPGGEPCVFDGGLHTVAAESLPAGGFRLRVQVWDGGRWRSVDGGGRPMALGQNAHCAPGGFEIRDADRTIARWEPGQGWRVVDGPAPAGDYEPVTTSTGRRYRTRSDGELVEMTASGDLRPTGVRIGGLSSSDPPPALQLDDAGGSLFWCTTAYLGTTGTTRCGIGSDARAPARPAAAPPNDASGPGPAGTVGHYNLCSAACGDGIRAHAQDLVAWLVARHRPVALSLNEQCYDDSVQLAVRLPDLQPAARYVALDSATACPGAVKQFGNQVLVRADRPIGAAWSAPFPSQSTQACDPRGQECRGVACAEVAGTVYCSAHLETSRHGPGVAERQAVDYLELVREHRRATGATVLAGDLNLSRAEADAVFEGSGYNAVSSGPTVSAHHSPARRQIDLIYVDDPVVPVRTASTHCDEQASDHCVVLAAFDLSSSVR